MRLARALPAHPLLDTAFSAGDVSFDHATTIVAAMATVPEQFLQIVEKALVEQALDATPRDIDAAAEMLLVACGVESSADEAAAKRYASRGLSIATTFNGIRSISGGLTPEVGEMLEQALAATAARTGPEDSRTSAQRAHDSLGDILRQHLADGDLAAINGERPRLVVTIDCAALTGALHDAWGRLPSGAVVSPATARRLSCDAEVIPAVLGARGDVLDIAVSSRSFSTAVRRAAWLEQGGSRAFPGCRRPPADCHHIIWWSHGGPSTLDNAGWLCAFHHWFLHEGNWTMRRDPDRSFTFTGPTGQERSSPRHPSAGLTWSAPPVPLNSCRAPAGLRDHRRIAGLAVGAAKCSP
jgi:hypothetical protein